MKIAECFAWIGRGFSVLLSVAQSILLVQFPIRYESNHLYWLLLLLCIPAVLPGLLIWYARGCYLRHLWLVWLLHTVVLIITTTVAFGLVEPNLSEDRDFGPGVFEMSLCISPLLLFLLLNVASDSSDKRRQVILISSRLTLDLFDGIGMLVVTLDNAGRPRDGVPREIRITIYILVLLVFLLSAFELRDQSSDDHVCDDGYEQEPSCCSCIRSVTQIVVNGMFLVLRLILWKNFKRPDPVFTTKSGISIVIHIIEMVESFC